MIGVQSDAAPAAYRSWRGRALVEDEMRTFAEGLATRVAFELPQQIMWELLDDFVLVSDDEIRAAQRADDRVDAQPDRSRGRLAARGGASTPRHAGRRRVALIASGGNASPEQLRELLGYCRG